MSSQTLGGIIPSDYALLGHHAVWELVRDFLKELFGKWPKSVVVAILLSGVSVYVVYKFYEAANATFAETVQRHGFQLAAAVSLLAIWVFTGLFSIAAYFLRPRPAGDRLHIAVANFYGNSDLANDEGRGLRTLIRHEIARRATQSGLKLVGELDAPVVADPASGIKYGQSVSAHLVVGGDVTALGQTIKFKPLICVAFPIGPHDEKSTSGGSISLGIDAPDHMQLAEAAASNVADLLAGISGLNRYQRDEFDAAIAAFLSIQEKTADVWSYLATAYLHIKPQRPDAAQSAARQAIARDPNAGAALNVDGVMLMVRATRGEPTLDEAQAQLERAAEIPESAPSALLNLGAIAQIRGKIDDAVRLYERSAQLAPSRVRPLTNATSALLGARRSKEAEKFARAAIARNPAVPIAHNLLGRALFQQARYRDAFNEYKVATELDGTYAIAFNSLGEAAYHLELPDESLAAFARAISIDRGYAHAYNNMGFVLKSLGRFPEAESNLKKAAELDANYPDPWNNLVGLYEQTGQGPELEAARAKARALAHLKSKSGAYSVFSVARSD